MITTFLLLIYFEYLYLDVRYNALYRINEEKRKKEFVDNPRHYRKLEKRKNILTFINVFQ